MFSAIKQVAHNISASVKATLDASLDSFESEDWVTRTNTPRSFELFTTISEEEEYKAKLASRETKGSAELIDDTTPYEPVSYLIFGCQGEGNSIQKTVATWMDTFIKTEGFTTHRDSTKKALLETSEIKLPTRTLPESLLTLPNVGFAAGDNVYHSGASSPRDPLFETCFHAPYKELLRHIIIFLAAGNHDVNYTSTNIERIAPHGIKLLSNQIAHTFMNAQGRIETEKLRYLSQSVISYEGLKKRNFSWIFPSRCYEVNFALHGVTVIVADSNHIGPDLVDYFNIQKTIIHLLQQKKSLEQYITSIEKTTYTGLSEEKPTTEIMETLIDPHKQKEELTEKIETISKQLKSLYEQLSNNQAYWLEESHIRHPNTLKTWIWHHPISPNTGKRSVKIDTMHYLRDSIKTLAEYKIPVYQEETTHPLPYGEILKNILMYLKSHRDPLSIEERMRAKMGERPLPAEPNLLSDIAGFQCAHEHIQSVYKRPPDPKKAEPEIFQYIAGGGGSRCNDGKKIVYRPYDEPTIQSMLVRTSYGFGVVTVNNEKEADKKSMASTTSKLYVEVFNIKGGYWCIGNKSSSPILKLSPISIKIEQLYEAIRCTLVKACHHYFMYRLKYKENASVESGLKLAVIFLNNLNSSKNSDIPSLIDMIHKIHPRSILMTDCIIPVTPKICEILKDHSIAVPEWLNELKKIDDLAKKREQEKDKAMALPTHENPPSFQTPAPKTPGLRRTLITTSPDTAAPSTPLPSSFNLWAAKFLSFVDTPPESGRGRPGATPK